MERKCYTLADLKAKYNLSDRQADKIKAWAKEHNFAQGPYIKPDFLPILEEAVQMKKEIGFHGRWPYLLDMAYKNLYGECGASSISGLIEFKDSKISFTIHETSLSIINLFLLSGLFLYP